MEFLKYYRNHFYFFSDVAVKTFTDDCKSLSTLGNITTNVCSKFQNNPYSAIWVISWTPFIKRAAEAEDGWQTAGGLDIKPYFGYGEYNESHKSTKNSCNRIKTLQWCHNESDGVSNHRRLGCLLNRLFTHRSTSASLAFVREKSTGHRRIPLTVTRKMFPFDDVIMTMHDNHTEIVYVKTSRSCQLNAVLVINGNKIFLIVSVFVNVSYHHTEIHLLFKLPRRRFELLTIRITKMKNKNLQVSESPWCNVRLFEYVHCSRFFYHKLMQRLIQLALS